jgi:hypothetical protein
LLARNADNANMAAVSPRIRSSRPTGRSNREQWPFEREGYDDRPAQAHSADRSPNMGAGPFLAVAEERVGSALAGASAIWVAWIGSTAGMSPAALVVDPRPVELAGVGILVWLHAKWRRWSSAR